MTKRHRFPFIPYPPIEGHGVIGDRRTAAVVAADGTIDWHCVPNYDGEPVFASLLDAEKGGFWRFGPREPIAGEQRYLDDTAVLMTEWETDSGKLELCDAMLWPEDVRPRGKPVACIIRRLRCLSGRCSTLFSLAPRLGFSSSPIAEDKGHGISISFGDLTFGNWNSFKVECGDGRVRAARQLSEGDVLWSIWGVNLQAPAGGAERLAELFEEMVSYWKNWSRDLKAPESERQQILRSAITVQILTYAPSGSAVAAVTSSLPERIGGEWNQDYRYAWVRDASLSLALLALLGKEGEVGKYLDWLSKSRSLLGPPLHVMYHIDGRPNKPAVELQDVAGYRDSRPVRVGNAVYKEHEHGAVGYVADCALIYLESGGKWKEEYWHLIRRIAGYTAEVWRQPDNGIWELPGQVQWVSSKVMAWVVLDRAVRIAEKLGYVEDAERWAPVREEIHGEVLEKGWSDTAGSFRQAYDSDEVDAALLLIPVMEFLPVDDPRVAATVRRIERELTVNGFVYRFHPEKTPGVNTDLPMGVYEGAFFPTTFWLATTYAKAGEPDKAEAILANCAQRAGGTGLFSEGVDAETGAYRGNTPLLFSHVEYARAWLAIDRYRKQSTIELPARKKAKKVA